VTDARVHSLCRVLAADYPAFSEQVALRALARELCCSLELESSPSAANGSLPTDETLADLLRPALGLEGAEAEDVLREAVLRWLRDHGLLDQQESANTGLDRWCTADELTLPARIRTTRAAGRALFGDVALLFADPFTEALKATGGHAVARTLLVDCLRFNAKLRKLRPTMHLAQLREQNVLSWFASRWGRTDMCDAVAQRGFADLGEFLRDARLYYLYDKAHPNRPALTINTVRDVAAPLLTGAK